MSKHSMLQINYWHILETYYHFDQFAAGLEIMNPDLESGAKNEVKPYFLTLRDA